MKTGLEEASRAVRKKGKLVINAGPLASTVTALSARSEGPR